MALGTFAFNIALMWVFMTVDAVIEGNVCEELEFLTIFCAFFVAFDAININVATA